MLIYIFIVWLSIISDTAIKWMNLLLKYCNETFFMGKLKRKRKKRSNVTDLKAIYNREMQLYLEEENYIAGLQYLYKAGKGQHY